MRSIFYYHFLILVPLLTDKTIVASKEDRLYDKIFSEAIGILFGRLWRFDQYCADSRSGSTVLKDDIEIQKFYNGTELQTLANANESALLQGLNQLNYLGIKSRSTSTVLCSINNWGYEEEDTFYLSNQPYDNGTECLSKIDQLYDALELSSTGKILAPFCIKSPVSYVRFAANKSRSSIYGNCSQVRKSFNQTINEWIQLNSFGRIPSGSPSNVHIWMGDYNGCLRLPDMRYCYGAYRMREWPADPSPSMMIAYRVGLCLPRACSSQLSQSREYLEKVDKLIKFNLTPALGFNQHQTYRLEEIYCPPAEDSHYRKPFEDSLSKFLLVVAIIWSTMIAFATNFNSSHGKLSEPQSTYKTLSNIFDLKLTWKQFMRDSHIAPELAGLNAFKVIHLTWLMFSHMYMLYASYSANKHEMRDTMNDSYMASSMVQGNHAVPVFFIISGLLVGHRHLRRKLDVPRLILYRYIRLLPMYLVVYAYVKKFGHLLGSGPLWDYGVSIQSEARQCRMESWLVPILMLGNFIPPFAHCILSGWHIANDFQIFLLVPFLLAAYRRSRSMGTLVAVGGFAMSHLHHVWNYYASNRWVFEQFALEPHILGARGIMDRLSFDYVNPFGRFGTLFLGVVLADLIDPRNRPTGEQDEQRSSSTEMSAITSVSMKNQIPSTSTPEDVPTERNNHQLSRSQTLKTERKNPLGSINSAIATLTENFKDKLPLMLGTFLFVFPLFCCAYTPNTKFFLGSLTHQSITYPIARLFIELGEFLFLYVLLRGQKQPPTRATNEPIEEGQQQWLSCLSIGDFLRKPIWNILVKLNYSLMLAHFTIARYLIQSRVQLLTFSWPNYFQYSMLLILLSYLVCCIVHLTIEMPLTSLIKLLVDKLDGSKTSEKRRKSVKQSPPVRGSSTAGSTKDQQTAAGCSPDCRSNGRRDPD